MSFTNRISQTLHDEHGATVALMERLEQLLARGRRGGPPDKADSNVARLLSDLSTGVESEVERHFSVRGETISSLIWRPMGDAGICEHLTSEHQAMRPLGTRVAALARAAASSGFTPESWEEFTRLGQELRDLMLAHVQKEEMALLPVIEENMDSETEARLYQEYVENV